jgi:diaminopimelate decarboxylase
VITDPAGVLDCAGLTPALTVLRIKQALAGCSDGHVRATLDPACSSETVRQALGDLAGRVRFELPALEPPVAAPFWWQRPDLRYRGGRLHLGETDLEELATQFGTPVYVCRAPRVRENLQRLAGALSAAGVGHRIYYAVKANRAPALLAYLRSLGLCGVDVCSVGELRHVMACGFPVEAISFTGTSLSGPDLEALARTRGLRINFDSVSSLERFGRLRPHTEVGLRINPGIGTGYQDDDRLTYSGAVTTKFGIYAEQVEAARAVARRYGLRITRLHVHAGCGFLDPQLHRLEQVLDAVDDLTRRFDGLTEINLGGGLGVPHSATEQPLDLRRWARAVASRFSGRGLVTAVEPGDYLVKDAGVLLTSVTYLERRRDVLFAGLDAGFNLAPEPAFYGLRCEPVAVTPRPDEGTDTYTVVGNINEALDVWAPGHRMPRLRDADRIALINSGGYAASMRSEHCLRGEAPEIVLIDDAPGDSCDR